MDQFFLHQYCLRERVDARGHAAQGERRSQARRGAAAIRASVRRRSRELRRH